MAYERGLLNQTDVNELQQGLLMSILVEEKVQEFKKEEHKFEKQIMLHRPEVWQKMQEEKEEAQEMGFDEIVWKTPESLEEFQEIEKLFGNAEQELVTVSNDTPSVIFSDIDLSELGEDDG